jgi:transcription termination factor Rho
MSDNESSEQPSSATTSDSPESTVKKPVKRRGRKPAVRAIPISETMTPSVAEVRRQGRRKKVEDDTSLPAKGEMMSLSDEASYTPPVVISAPTVTSPKEERPPVRRDRSYEEEPSSSSDSADDGEIPQYYTTDDDSDEDDRPRDASHSSPEKEASTDDDRRAAAEGEQPSNQSREHSQHDRGNFRDNRDSREGRDRFQKKDFNKNKFQKKDFNKNKFQKKGPFQPQGHHSGHQGGGHQGQSSQGFQPRHRRDGSRSRNEFSSLDTLRDHDVGTLPSTEWVNDLKVLAEKTAMTEGNESVCLNELTQMKLPDLISVARDRFEWTSQQAPVRSDLIDYVLQKAFEQTLRIEVEGIVEMTADGYALIVFESDNYRVRFNTPYVTAAFVREFGLKRGHIVKGRLHPKRIAQGEEAPFEESCPFLIAIDSIMGKAPELNRAVIPFEELTPYYPTERIILESPPGVPWDNLSMRVVDLLTPVGLGQRGLIVAPPRTGKTILQQGIANAILQNKPEAHLIILLVDERPEEVTDFRRQIKRGEVIASTFDESPENHVHVAEMVIEKSRRMVEAGQHVIILLDSITRLARAYNALAANSGKILSGGVEATALQKPKRFFGSARNIEGGGSLTILGTALVDTGSRMDEVIFEEFKGTGNMEVHLDRGLVDKRIFPAISLEQSGTRKEELLYHPDEMLKVYGLRRAMKGVPSTEAMEMLINRIKKTKSNIEFLMGLQR